MANQGEIDAIKTLFADYAESVKEARKGFRQKIEDAGHGTQRFHPYISQDFVKGAFEQFVLWEKIARARLKWRVGKIVGIATLHVFPCEEYHLRMCSGKGLAPCFQHIDWDEYITHNNLVEAGFRDFHYKPPLEFDPDSDEEEDDGGLAAMDAEMDAEEEEEEHMEEIELPNFSDAWSMHYEEIKHIPTTMVALRRQELLLRRMEFGKVFEQIGSLLNALDHLLFAMEHMVNEEFMFLNSARFLRSDHPFCVRLYGPGPLVTGEEINVFSNEYYHYGYHGNNEILPMIRQKLHSIKRIIVLVP